MVGSRSWHSFMIDNQIISSCWTPPLFLIAFLFLITEETKAAWFERPVLGRSQQTWCGDRISLLWEGERQDADAACPWCMSFLYTHLDFYHSEMCEIYTTLITSLSLISDIYPATSKSDPLNFLKISDIFLHVSFPQTPSPDSHLLLLQFIWENGIFFSCKPTLQIVFLFMRSSYSWWCAWRVLLCRHSLYPSTGSWLQWGSSVYKAPDSYLYWIGFFF